MCGVKEKELSVKITIDTERIEDNIKQYKIPRHASSSSEFLFEAYKKYTSEVTSMGIEKVVKVWLGA